jgi:hypothetical protein
LKGRYRDGKRERGYIELVLIVTRREKVISLGNNGSLDLCGEEPLASIGEWKSLRQLL